MHLHILRTAMQRLIMHLRICQEGTLPFPEQGQMSKAKLTLHTALCGTQQLELEALWELNSLCWCWNRFAE